MNGSSCRLWGHRFPMLLPWKLENSSLTISFQKYQKKDISSFYHLLVLEEKVSFHSYSLQLEGLAALDHFLLPQVYCFVYFNPINWTQLLLTHKPIKNKVFPRQLKINTPHMKSLNEPENKKWLPSELKQKGEGESLSYFKLLIVFWKPLFRP